MMGSDGPLPAVLARLSQVRAQGDGYTALCPAHDDQHASLSVGIGEEGQVPLHCFAGCLVESIVSALGLTQADLFPRNGQGRAGGDTYPPPPDDREFHDDAHESWENDI